MGGIWHKMLLSGAGCDTKMGALLGRWLLFGARTPWRAQDTGHVLHCCINCRWLLWLSKPRGVDWATR